jgi:hypothetical protein
MIAGVLKNIAPRQICKTKNLDWCKHYMSSPIWNTVHKASLAPVKQSNFSYLASFRRISELRNAIVRGPNKLIDEKAEVKNLVIPSL